MFQADANAILPIAWMDAVVNFTERRVYNICFVLKPLLRQSALQNNITTGSQMGGGARKPPKNYRGIGRGRG